jgi:enamine deaminase RidA (YjgF/YER057c/UK114 family)
MSIEERLKELGLELPAPPKPAGGYQAWRRSGSLLFLSGQFPIRNDRREFIGRIGVELTEEEGRAAAQLAALNVLAQIQSALNGFDRLETLLRVEGHVASGAGWNNAPTVLDAASNLLVAALGERGCHTRTAFTPERLPFNLPIELVVTAAMR